MTTWDKANQLPPEHKQALAALLSVVAEKYIEAVEKEINDDIQRIQ